MTLVFDTSALVAMHVAGAARAIAITTIQGDEMICCSALALSEAIALEIGRASCRERV